MNGDENQAYDPLLVHACNELSFHLQTSDTIAEQIIRSQLPKRPEIVYAKGIVSALECGDATVDDISNIVLELLVDHSVPYIIYPWMPQWEEEEEKIISILEKRPVPQGNENRRDTEIDIGMTQFYPIFYINHSQIVRGYYALHYLLVAMLQQNDTTQTITCVEKSISCMVCPQHRFVVLKNMFTLMFLRSSHLRNKDAEDRFLIDIQLLESTLCIIRHHLETADAVEGHDLSQFRENVADMSWRFEFARYARSNDITQSNFINLMIASPETFLTIALRRNDFDKARSVIDRYGKLSHCKDEIDIFEAAHNIRESFKNEAKDRFDRLQEFMSRPTVPFGTLMDIITSINAPPPVLLPLLQRAKELCPQEERSGVFDRMKALMDHFDNRPLYMSSMELFSQIGTAKQIREKLQLQTERRKRISRLCAILSGSIKVEHSEWRETAQVFGEGYLGIVIEHAYKMADIVNCNVLEILSASPREIATRLIFVEQHYDEAIRMCAINHIEPLQLVIDALTSDKPAPLTVDIVEKFLKRICEKSVVIVMICALSLSRQKTRQDIMSLLRDMVDSMGSTVVCEWWKSHVESLFNDLAQVESNSNQNRVLNDESEKRANMINILDVNENSSFYFAVSR